RDASPLHGYTLTTVSGHRYPTREMVRGKLLLLQLLLVLADLGQTRVVGDIRRRPVDPGLPVRAGRLLPARRPHPQLLAEQGGEDLRFLPAEAGQRRQPLHQLRPGGRLPPDRGSVTAVLLHDDPAQLLGPPGHRRREAVQRGRGGEDLHQLLRIMRGQGGRVQPGCAEPLGQPIRSPERPLHRDLLVQQYPDQESQRVAGEAGVGLALGGEAERTQDPSLPESPAGIPGPGRYRRRVPPPRRVTPAGTRAGTGLPETAVPAAAWRVSGRLATWNSSTACSAPVPGTSCAGSSPGSDRSTSLRS